MAINRYQLGEPLGNGGMGVVLAANDTWSGKTVAIKVMSSSTVRAYEDVEQGLRRFLREIETAKSLHHQHVLEAIDDGKIEIDVVRRLLLHRPGKLAQENVQKILENLEYLETEHKLIRLPCLVSPYMPDGSLEQLIYNEHPYKHWRLPQIADTIRQAAQGLQYLHDFKPNPKTHQDVKPANFLVSIERRYDHIGHFYLCDFGITREQTIPPQPASGVLGTIAYMAPEQFELHVNCASDQYALAVIACQLLTGKFPIQPTSGGQAAYILAHQRLPPKLPRALNPKRITSPEIDQVIAKALSKLPEQRYPKIIDFADELRRAIEKQVQASQPTSIHTLFPQASPRGPVAPLVVPANVVGTPIYIPPVSYDEHQPVDEAIPLILPRKHVNVQAKNSLLPPSKATPIFTTDLEARPRHICWSMDSHYLFTPLYGHKPVLLDPAHKSAHIVPNVGIAHTACWSPYEDMLAIGAHNPSKDEHELLLWNTNILTEPPVILEAFRAMPIEALDWSIRGQIAAWVGKRIFLYRLPPNASSMRFPLTHETLNRQDMRCGNISALRWSPDGSLLAAGTVNGNLHCWRTDENGPSSLQWSVTEPGERIYSLAWSPDGALLAVAFRNRKVEIWDIQKQHKRLWGNPLPGIPCMLSISRQSHLAIASHVAQVGILIGKLTDTAPTAMFPGQLLAAWSPTRPQLATVHHEQDTQLVVYQL